MPFRLDDLYLLLCGGRYTSLNANPTVFTGPALDMTAANAAAAGDVIVTTPVAVAGAYMPQLTSHTALLYPTQIDNSNIAKRIRTVDAGGIATEGVVSFFILQRQQPV